MRDCPAGAAAVLIPFSFNCGKATRAEPGREAEYPAVFLDSGAASFRQSGKVQSLKTPYPTLTEFFHVQSNIPLKRGSEWHGPGWMTIDAGRVVFVKPVSTGPQAANRIAQTK